MYDRVGDQGASFDLTAAASLPFWSATVIAAFVLAVCALAFIRGDGKGRPAQVAGAVLVLLAGCWVLDYWSRRDLAAERRELDARAFELATRAFVPGSALACLDAVAGDLVEDSCEKALFASPEATAAAVSYVAAELSLLASASDHARRAGGSHGKALATLHRAVEADRFGIVAHVLATRDGCTPNQCIAFAFLQGTGRVSANLAERTFELHVKNHVVGWLLANRPVANEASPNASPSAPVASARPPSGINFPSSASIPPVNIMTAEPAAQPPHDTTGAAARKPSQTAQPARPPAGANNAAGSAAPLQIAPVQ